MIIKLKTKWNVMPLIRREVILFCVSQTGRAARNCIPNILWYLKKYASISTKNYLAYCNIQRLHSIHSFLIISWAKHFCGIISTMFRLFPVHQKHIIDVYFQSRGKFSRGGGEYSRVSCGSFGLRWKTLLDMC